MKSPNSTLNHNEYFLKAENTQNLKEGKKLLIWLDRNICGETITFCFICAFLSSHPAGKKYNFVIIWRGEREIISEDEISLKVSIEQNWSFSSCFRKALESLVFFKLTFCSCNLVKIHFLLKPHKVFHNNVVTPLWPPSETFLVRSHFVSEDKSSRISFSCGNINLWSDSVWGEQKSSAKGLREKYFSGEF